MKVLAVGDVHTKLWVIDRVRKLADHYDAVVFCGDYADDWDANPIDSINTWKEVRSLKHSKPHVRLVQGNHDYIYTNKTPTLQSGYNPKTQALIDAAENRHLRDWLHSLPITLKLDGVTYSHAGISEPWDTTSLWCEDSPLWNRPGWHPYKAVPQVFGHTPQKTCTEVRPGSWCIDTFSTHRDGSPIGDKSLLEVIDGRLFNVLAWKSL